jgi:hypothetical protein
LTDGFAGYRGADLGAYLKHTPVVQGAGANAGQFFPIIHTLFSNIKAWLVGTHHAVSAKHLPRYLREWSYRFNRRNLPNGLDRYLIRRAVECATITYDQLIAGGGYETFSLSKERFFLVRGELGNHASAHRGDSEVR